MMPEENKKFGVVALLGMPNAGKSTLLNALMGEKLAIVSHKVQTTRFPVRGIHIGSQSQIVFVDTPGVLKPKKTLDRAMLSSIHDALSACDALLILVDVSHPQRDAHLETALTFARKNNLDTLYLVMNKVDKVAKQTLLPMAAKMGEAFDWKAVFMISAQSGSGVDRILTTLEHDMPEGPWGYDSETLTDMPMRVWSSELIRERIYHFIHDEIPYALTVECEEWQETDKRADIKYMIIVQRDTQKAVILGKGGQMIKKIGQSVREEMEEALEKKVRLEIFVRVRKDWQNDPERYQALGLTFPG